MKAVLALSALIAASIFGFSISGLWHGPVHLSCHGQFIEGYHGKQDNKESKEARTLHAIIDLSKGTVGIEAFYSDFKVIHDGASLVNFDADPSADNVWSGTGKIDRYTGRLFADEQRTFETTGTLISNTFDGVCQQAERLF